jgi:hypothetical protein
VTWFKVDDSFHSNSKVRKVAAREPAALALWVLAGSWSSAHLTDGFVSDNDLPWILPGSEPLAAELVAARLWRRVKGGYQFHDWTQANPTAEQVLKLRAQRAAAGSKGGRSRAQGSSKSQASAAAVAKDGLEPPSRPGPFLPSEERKGPARAPALRVVPDLPPERKWCGYCHKDTRMAVDDETDRSVPCPVCHPRRSA